MHVMQLRIGFVSELVVFSIIPGGGCHWVPFRGRQSSLLGRDLHLLGINFKSVDRHLFCCHGDTSALIGFQSCWARFTCFSTFKPSLGWFWVSCVVCWTSSWWRDIHLNMILNCRDNLLALSKVVHSTFCLWSLNAGLDFSDLFIHSTSISCTPLKSEPMLWIYCELRWCSVFIDILSRRIRQDGAWFCSMEEENDEKVKFFSFWKMQQFSKLLTECGPEI